MSASGPLVLGVPTSSAHARRALGALVTQLLAETKEPLHLVYYSEQVTGEQWVERAEDIVLVRQGAGVNAGAVIRHLQKQGVRPRALLAFAGLLRRDGEEAPPYPVLWLAEDPYRPEAPYGSILPQEALSFLHLARTAEALPPAREEVRQGPAYVPARPVLAAPRPLSRSEWMDEEEWEPVLASLLSVEEAEKIHQEIWQGFQQGFDQFETLYLAGLEKSRLARFDTLLLRGHVPSPGTVEEMRTRAERQSEGVPLYLRLSASCLRPESLRRLHLAHPNLLSVVEPLLLHPVADSSLAEQALDQLSRFNERGRAQLMTALATRRDFVQASPRLRPLIEEHGSALAWARLARFSEGEDFARLCRRLRGESLPLLATVLEEASEAQTQGLTRFDWAQMLASPLAPLRLAALRRQRGAGPSETPSPPCSRAR